MGFQDLGDEMKIKTAEAATPTYSTQHNVGCVKYLVNFQDGQKTHQDGSPFFDVRTFKNKQKRDAFVDELRGCGYSEA
jgi:hypothetical protein